jgi:hypothetical protein
MRMHPITRRIREQEKMEKMKMLGSNDTKFVQQLDPRLGSIIMEPQQSGDRGCLVAVLHVVNGTKAEKRADVWKHFERSIANRVKDHVRRMHVAYDVIASELASKPKTQGQLAYEAAMAKVAEARSAER